MEGEECPRFGYVIWNDRNDIQAYERLENHIKIDLRNYAMESVAQTRVTESLNFFQKRRSISARCEN
jgi:hypothetical protein